MSRNVRGSLFADYVRMIRKRKDIDWDRYLAPEDRPHVGQPVDPERWYPMETFERLGNAILAEIAHGEVAAVRIWGRLAVGDLQELYPQLVVPGDPMESLMRFKVLRGSFFDFDAFDIPVISEREAHVVTRFQMGRQAEEAASYQTLGFCEGLLALAEATDVSAEFKQRAWAGDPRTLLELTWRMPGT